MLSKRAIAIAADKAIRKRLSAGLMAAGADAQAYAAPGEMAEAIEVEVVAVCLAGEGDRAWLDEIASRVGEKVPIVAVVPQASLDDTVALMQDGRVAAVLADGDFEHTDVAGVAARILFGDIFGVDKLVPWGVRVHAVLVGDYEEKSTAITEISEYADRVGVRRKYRELIEQCLDEMLMNALYDAPVDERGTPIFRSMPVKERLARRLDKKALVEYACDGTTFAMSVRDSFGTLDRATVVWYLDKCLHAAEQIDRKEGGAGLGLYLIANSTTQFFVNLQPGVATEATCLFDLTAPKLQLSSFGIFEEKPETAAQPSAGDASSAAALGAQAPRGLMAALLTSVILLLVLIGMVAYPRLAPVPRGDVRATTEPAGAVIEIDDRIAGTTGDEPVEVRDLEADARYIVAARKAGFREALSIVTPREDEVTDVHLVLEREGVPVMLATEPPGADVIVGEEMRGRTPLELELPAGTRHEVRFEREGYAPVTEVVEVPVEGKEHRMSAPLTLAPGFAAVSLETQPPGARVIVGGEEVAGLQTPVEDLLLAPGDRHAIELALDGYAPAVRSIILEEGEHRPIDAELERGARLSVSVNIPQARISVAQLPDCQGVVTVRCPAPTGSYHVRIASDDPFLRHRLPVEVADEDVSRVERFGVVETETERFALAVDRGPEDIRRVAFRPGQRQVRIVDTETDESREKTVDVIAGESVMVTWE